MDFPAGLRDFQNLSAQQWLDRASRTLPLAVSVLLVIAIAWQLVQITWLLLDRGASTGASLTTPDAAPSPTHKAVDTQAIVNAHLFGSPEAAPDVTDVKVSQTNLVLSAVFATNDPSRGLAIIGESAQGAKVYTVGATVRPGTVLQAVYPDKVILDRGGQLESLNLPKQNTANVQINRPPGVQVPNQQFAENLRRLAQTNPSAFAEVVRPQPVFANGVQRGYRVYPGRNRQQFAKLGLQPGDLVLSVNGTPLDDPQRGMEIFNTIGTSDRVALTIERNGQSQELTLNTAQLTLPDANAPQTPPSRPSPRPNTPIEPEE